jgi:hypothetical protein
MRNLSQSGNRVKKGDAMQQQKPINKSGSDKAKPRKGPELFLTSGSANRMQPTPKTTRTRTSPPAKTTHGIQSRQEGIAGRSNRVVSAMVLLLAS